MPINVAPSGLPRFARRLLLPPAAAATPMSSSKDDGSSCEGGKTGSSWIDDVECPPPDDDMDLFRRKSCVMAIPMDAKARDVRSQARKVRSTMARPVVSVQVGSRKKAAFLAEHT